MLTPGHLGAGVTVHRSRPRYPGLALSTDTRYTQLSGETSGHRLQIVLAGGVVLHQSGHYIERPCTVSKSIVQLVHHVHIRSIGVPVEGPLSSRYCVWCSINKR